MLRRLLLSAVFVLGGAIVTVVIAWILAARRPALMAPGFHFSHETDPLWYFAHGREAGSEWVFCGVTPIADVGGWECRPDLCPPWSLVSDRPTVEQAGADLDVWWEEARGWPWLALAGRVRMSDGLLVEEAPWSIVVGGQASPVGLPRLLPLRPVWPGFVVDTLVYAAGLGVTVLMPGAVRRRWRSSRGRCPRCAYPIGASPVCTECGGALSRSVSRERSPVAP